MTLATCVRAGCPCPQGGIAVRLLRLGEIATQVLSFHPTAYRHYKTLVYLGSLLAFGNALKMSLLRNELNINRYEHWWIDSVVGADFGGVLCHIVSA